MNKKEKANVWRGITFGKSSRLFKYERLIIKM